MVYCDACTLGSHWRSPQLWQFCKVACHWIFRQSVLASQFVEDGVAFWKAATHARCYSRTTDRWLQPAAAVARVVQPADNLVMQNMQNIGYGEGRGHMWVSTQIGLARLCVTAALPNLWRTE
jgi:hypothetical protein